MIFDFHNDALTCDNPDYSGDLYAVTHAIWSSKLDYSGFLKVLDRGRRLNFPFKTPLAIEDLHFLDDKILQDFDFSEFLYCSLTWNGENALAGGVGSEAGLTDFGRKVVKTIRASCDVDVSHLNERSFYDVIDLCPSVCASHTFIDEENPRALNVERAKLVASRGGIIGIFFVTSFTGRTTAESVAEGIARAVDCVGVRHIAIGTDFNGSKDLPKRLTKYSDFDRLKEELAKLGFSDEEIRDIFFYNLYNRYKERL